MPKSEAKATINICKHRGSLEPRVFTRGVTLSSLFSRKQSPSRVPNKLLLWKDMKQDPSMIDIGFNF